MNQFEAITILLSIVAIFISIASLKKSSESMKKSEIIAKEQNKLAQEQNQLAQGEIELNIHGMIQDTKMALINMSCKIRESKDEYKGEYKEVFLSLIENHINAYEQACSKYLDNKVDKTRFRKTYFIELRQLVQNKEYKDYFAMPASSYNAILTVYKEWYDLEN